MTNFSQAIKNFATLTFSPDPDDLKGDIYKKDKLATQMKKIDLNLVIAKNEYRRRKEIVENSIDPSRKQILEDYNVEDHTFFPVAKLTPYLSDEKAHLVSNGILQFFKGDFCSALSILGLQIEHSLRCILEMDDVKTSFIRRVMGRDRDHFFTLPEMMRNKCKENALRIILEDQISKSVMFEIENLFHSPDGPSLRHRLAHGLVSWDEFNSTDAIYACWFLFHLYCLPLLSDWDSVAYEIEKNYDPY